MKSLLLILVGSFQSVLAFAQEHAEEAVAAGAGHGTAVTEHAAAAGEHHAAIPWDHVVIPQAINFLIFAGILVFLLRKPIKEFFASRGNEYLARVRQAEEVKLQAEKAHAEVQTRLRTLEATAAKNAEEAKSEAAALRARMIKEAQEAAVKTAKESERGVQYEHTRAIAALRSELVANSIKFAQDKVKSSVDTNAINDLQTGFTRKLKSVRQ